MKLTPTTSPTLQRFLNAEYDSPESHYTTEFDIHCKAAVKAGLNANSSGCVSRLTGDKVPKCCRQCETGREVLARVNPEAVVTETMCKCDRKAVVGRTKCQKCIDAANDYAKTLYKSRNKDYQRKCKNCQSDIESHVTYCATCRPIIAEEKRLKKNADRKHATLLRKQKRIEQQLAALG